MSHTTLLVGIVLALLIVALGLWIARLNSFARMFDKW